jgi:hypothetical protein
MLRPKAGGLHPAVVPTFHLLQQELLRHSNIRTTLDIYAQAITPKKLEAQGTFLRSLLAQGEATGLVQ